MKTTTVGIRDAKIHLSKYVKMVQKGNEIILTDHGRPVGKIVPMATRDLPIEERVKQLEDNGLLEQDSGRLNYKIPRPIPVPEGIAQVFLQQDRDHD